MRVSLVITLLTTLIPALATAYTKPDYNKEPKGNAISKPGLDDPVEAGKPYTIEWKADTPGPISIVLLRGPSNNVKPIDTLAEKINNNGTFEWTPSKDLEPDTTHYGIMIVVEKSGQYQYSTQFGVKNPGYKKEDHKDDDKNKTATITSAPTTSTPSDNDYSAPTTSWSSFPVTRTICPLCVQYAFATPFAFTTMSAVPIVGTTSTATPMSSYGYSNPGSSGMSSSAASRSMFIGASDRSIAGLAVAVTASVLAILIM